MKDLLLHSCCGPCSTAVIDELKNKYNVIIFYYNPNIYPFLEYEKRKAEQIKYATSVGIKVIEGKWDEKSFLDISKGFENCKEGEARCEICFRQRLDGTAQKAKELNIDNFCTTLTVSPYKNAELINKIGMEIAKARGLTFLEFDFKKNDGYLKSIRLSKEFGLYRQNYCGCRFSIRK